MGYFVIPFQVARTIDHCTHHKSYLSVNVRIQELTWRLGVHNVNSTDEGVNSYQPQVSPWLFTGCLNFADYSINQDANLLCPLKTKRLFCLLQLYHLQMLIMEKHWVLSGMQIGPRTSSIVLQLMRIQMWNWFENCEKKLHVYKDLLEGMWWDTISSSCWSM